MRHLAGGPHQHTAPGCGVRASALTVGALDGADTEELAAATVKIVLVGNKADEASQREVSAEEVSARARPAFRNLPAAARRRANRACATLLRCCLG